MASVEEVISELKKLRPEQVDEVARVVHLLAHTESGDANPSPAVPIRLVDTAVEHGWPAGLFQELIGSLPDLERAPQPSAERRSDL